MQKFKFPMEYLRVTQGENNIYSHEGSLAMDFGGKDTGSDPLFCPCDMIVKRTRTGANGEMYLESVEPVQFADGSVNYARLLCVHDNSFNKSVGDVVKQGEHFYDEGGMGSGVANKFGTHVHMEAGKGKWKNTNQTRNYAGTYVIENQEHLYNLFFVGKDVVVLDNGGYKWISEDETPSENFTGEMYGVDLSNNNEKVSFKNIIHTGKAKFAVLRACVGSESVDKMLDKFLEEYYESDAEMLIGFYAANYYYTVEDARAEADFLCDTIEARGFAPSNVNLPLFCDWEGFSYEWNASQGRVISSELLQEMTEAFCERIIERGYNAGVYTNLSYWNNMFTQKFFNDHPSYYIWYTRPGYNQPDRDCYIWQYASNAGTEFGTFYDIDKDILMGAIVNNIWEKSEDYYIATKSNCEYFNSLKLTDVAGKLVLNEVIQLTEICTTLHDGYIWGKFMKDGKEYYIALLSDRIQIYMPPAIDAEWMIMDENYYVTIATNCEYFYEPDVNKVVGKFPKDVVVNMIKVGELDGMNWGKFIGTDGDPYYTVLLPDRIVPYIIEEKVEAPVEEIPNAPSEPDVEIPVEPEQPEQPVKEENWFVKFLRWLLSIFTTEE